MCSSYPCLAATYTTLFNSTWHDGTIAQCTWQNRNIQLPSVWTEYFLCPMLAYEPHCPYNTSEVSRVDNKRSHVTLVMLTWQLAIARRASWPFVVLVVMGVLFSLYDWSTHRMMGWRWTLIGQNNICWTSGGADWILEAKPTSPPAGQLCC